MFHHIAFSVHCERLAFHGDDLWTRSDDEVLALPQVHMRVTPVLRDDVCVNHRSKRGLGLLWTSIVLARTEHVDVVTPKIVDDLPERFGVFRETPNGEGEVASDVAIHVQLFASVDLVDVDVESVIVERLPDVESSNESVNEDVV